jgi:NNP family nitrate/nitrite transporter-like MFS transporter
MFLYLPKLLTGVHHLSKTDAGARAAGFALLAVVARPTGGWLADRIGASRVLLASFVGVAVLACVLAATYEHMVPLTIACLALAVFLGLGTGAVFKLVAEWFPDRVGSVTGVVGAAGGLGGFFPPLVMGAVKSATGGYGIGFLLMALVALVCLGVLGLLARAGPAAGAVQPGAVQA